jgi:hypothetical protein
LIVGELLTKIVLSDGGPTMTIEVNSGPRWTDEDQANHTSSMKQELAALLKDNETFAALDCVPMSMPITAENRAVTLLRVAVCALRHELIAWADK